MTMLYLAGIQKNITIGYERKCYVNWLLISFLALSAFGSTQCDPTLASVLKKSWMEMTVLPLLLEVEQSYETTHDNTTCRFGPKWLKIIILFHH